MVYVKVPAASFFVVHAIQIASRGVAFSHTGYVLARFQPESNSLWEMKGKDMRKVQCFDRKEYGHIAANCAKKSCNYYK